MRGVALLVRLAQRTADCGRLMVGMPSYTDYLLHQRSHHPEAMPMNRAEFVRNRQAARFGGGGRGGFRCC
ncbi:YbdD/YjiX family protein [Novosphingobium sp. Gsoil 351]|uniref:YbdD/YjiX family protein n=1 Tax=Novosphingobium sp. Gsoil 351 TaxID=2675225 RepID=UPI0012B49F91|nr:YbdD/YjiX family protein [Novosphingobium sp. Gsoil 351]QGN55701.1 putative selenoprotein [Novosphingobium sp. Gsoil 351]